ncbi:hypothetical protein F4778DRAFT_753696 [Xylariomycetidae sp. FL2044]|nr:hypothetical protein F4778DRAFT_753696 [Xylariomycetidae sp. FL2044]
MPAPIEPPFGFQRLQSRRDFTISPLAACRAGGFPTPTAKPGPVESPLGFPRLQTRVNPSIERPESPRTGKVPLAIAESLHAKSPSRFRRHPSHESLSSASPEASNATKRRRQPARRQARSVSYGMPLPENPAALPQRPGGRIRIHLVEPVAAPRINLPQDLVKYISRVTFKQQDSRQRLDDVYVVTAYSDSGDGKHELYCGSFSYLNLANDKVLHVFARDVFRLMGDRYPNMRFREAGEPPEPDLEGESEPWTAFSLESEVATLRLWARGADWSYRVEDRGSWMTEVHWLRVCVL